MNAFEKIVAAVAPGFAAERAMQRLRLERINEASRNYEGSAQGRRTKNWKTQSRDANAEIAPALTLLRNRSRDLSRNNCYATSAVESIVDNMVGYGIRPAPRGRNKTATKRAKEAWKAHCETKGIDFDDLHDVYGLQALAGRTMVESGAVLLRRHLLTTQQMKAKGLTLPFQIQVLEPDFIDMRKDGEQKDGSIDIHGIRYEKAGGVRGYWLFENHPGAAGMHLNAVSNFVPARDVIHLFRIDRPGQVHGVPWSAPVMLRLRNFDEYEDAELERQKVAACFSVIYTVPEPDAGKTKMEIADRLEPGGQYFAPPGSGVEFATPTGTNGYKDFAWVNLHAIATGYGVPYEELAGDLQGVNFSSGRMGWQKYQRRIERWQWQMFIPRLCGGVWSWFESSCQFAGILSENCPVEWVPPRRMMVNPKEEIAALKEAIRNGFETWGNTLRSLGYDPETQAEEIELFNKLLDKHELKLDCDPRFALPAGSAGATQQDAGSNAGNDDSKAGSSGKSNEGDAE